MSKDLRIIGEQRALEWCRLCIEAMRKNPILIKTRARRNLQIIDQARSCSPEYIARWRTLLTKTPDEIATTVLANTDDARVLRTTAPFAALLPPKVAANIREKIK